ncbi:hypothetical protein C0Q70_14195 [Pomacea canaliculata]|uniref:Uncharacterized protein n=1 Tax=Pomacea canaliculata TaxID=400727 RepID=A0A2T7NZD0_POMCA|nr:hypothetical protein C0Q70_14195 [Pomacea canaliculata]
MRRRGGWVGTSFTIGMEHHPGCKAGWVRPPVGTSFTHWAWSTTPAARRGGWVGTSFSLDGGAPPRLQAGWVGRHQFTTGRSTNSFTNTRLQGGVGGRTSFTTGQEHHPAATGWVGRHQLYHWAEHHPGCKAGGGSAPALPLGRSTTPAARRGGWSAPAYHWAGAPPGCKAGWWGVGTSFTTGQEHHPAARRGGWVGTSFKPLGRSTTRLQGGVGGSAPAYHWGGTSTTRLQGGVGGRHSFTTGQEHHPGCSGGWAGTSFTTGQEHHRLAQGGVGGCGTSFYHWAASTTGCKAGWVGRTSFTTGRGPPPRLQGGVGGRHQLYHWAGAPPRLQGGVGGSAPALPLAGAPPRLQGGVGGRHQLTTAGAPPRLQGGWVGTSFTTGQEHHPGCKAGWVRRHQLLPLPRLQGGVGGSASWAGAPPRLQGSGGSAPALPLGAPPLLQRRVGRVGTSFTTGQEHHPAAGGGWVGTSFTTGRSTPAGWVGRHQLYHWAGAPPRLQGGVGGSAPALPLQEHHSPGCKAGGWVGTSFTTGRSTPRLQGGWWVGTSFTTGQEHHPAARRGGWVGTSFTTGQEPPPRLQGGVEWVGTSFTTGPGAPPRLQGGVGRPPALPLGAGSTTRLASGWGSHQLYQTLASTTRLQGGVGGSAPAFTTGQSTTPAARRGGWVAPALPLGRSTTPACKAGLTTGGCFTTGAGTTPAARRGGGSAPALPGQEHHPGCKAVLYHWAGAPPGLQAAGQVVSAPALPLGRSTTPLQPGHFTTAGTSCGVVGGSAPALTGRATPRLQGGVGGRSAQLYHWAGAPPRLQGAGGGRHQLLSPAHPAAGWVGPPALQEPHWAEHHPGGKAGGWVGTSFTTGRSTTPAAGVGAVRHQLYQHGMEAAMQGVGGWDAPATLGGVGRGTDTQHWWARRVGGSALPLGRAPPRLQAGVGGQEHHPGRHQLYHWQTPPGCKAGWVGPGQAFTTGRKRVGGSAPSFTTGRSTMQAGLGRHQLLPLGNQMEHHPGGSGICKAGWDGSAPALPLGRSTTRCKAGGCGRHQLYTGRSTTRLRLWVGRTSFTTGRAPPGCKAWVVGSAPALALAEHHPRLHRRGGWVGTSFNPGQEHHTRLQQLEGGVGVVAHTGCKAGVEWVATRLTGQSTTRLQGGVVGRHQLYTGQEQTGPRRGKITATLLAPSWGTTSANRAGGPHLGRAQGTSIYHKVSTALITQAPPGCKAGWWVWHPGGFGLYTGQSHWHPSCKAGGGRAPSFTTGDYGRGKASDQAGCSLRNWVAVSTTVVVGHQLYHCASRTATTVWSRCKAVGAVGTLQLYHWAGAPPGCTGGVGGSAPAFH